MFCSPVLSQAGELSINLPPPQSWARTDGIAQRSGRPPYLYLDLGTIGVLQHVDPRGWWTGVRFE